jgi:acyl-lipid omega-6 desaturase (Delta-12 desaturase)
VRTDKELLLATKAFAFDDPRRSWWYLCSTLTAYFCCLAVCFVDVHWMIRLPVSIISGLVIVRMFIIYHDYQHHAILGNSRLAGAIMTLYGMLVLSPSSVWNRSHDHHHKHNCKDKGEHIGSFPVMTCQQYLNSTRWQKSLYVLARHPLTIGLGYLTVFMGGMCIRGLILSPRRHIDAGFALILHLALILFLAWVGWQYLLFCLMLPLMIACATGSYLFYAQHNFPTCKLDRGEEWNYVGAALHSSSYMHMNPVMHWFTGNIGYHHIHHLNAKIPFYKLPEAMRTLAELQKPSSTSLGFRDILACFNVNLWCPTRKQFVTFREARAEARR